MFAKNLFQLRRQMDLSQEFMAQSLNINRITYAKLESGKKSPTLAELEKIAQTLEVSIEELINAKAVIPERPVAEIDLPKQEAVIQPRPEIKLDAAKLESVLLYVLGKVSSRPNIGETVLYKLLYFIDFDYYEKCGQSITGMKYVNNHYGPTPDMAVFGGLIKTLEKQRKITKTKTIFHGKPQKKYLSNIEPNLRIVSGQEIEHINEVLGKLEHKTAKAITDYAHQDTPWLITEPGEIIDYQLSKYRTPITSVIPEEDEL